MSDIPFGTLESSGDEHQLSLYKVDSLRCNFQMWRNRQIYSERNHTAAIFQDN